MNRSFLFLAALVSATYAAAEPVPPQPTAPDPATAPKVESYTLKKRSTFTLTSEHRAPFIPIGWQKSLVPTTNVKKPGAVVVTHELEIRPEHFTLTSVLSGQSGQIALATINGRAYAEGETLPVTFNGAKVQVVLRSVRDGGVTLEYNQKTIVVPLKRSEPIPRATGSPDSLVKPPSIDIETRPKGTR